MSPSSGRDYRRALDHLEGRGFIPLFANKHLPSFYTWVVAELGNHDPNHDVPLTWDIANDMAERRDAYYGKLFRKDYILAHTGFLAVLLRIFPLSDARDLYWSGGLSRKAWDAFGILEPGPRTTVAINQALGARDRPARAEVAKALDELMLARVACRTGEAKRPGRGWGIAVWDLLERWLPEGIHEEARALDLDYARGRLRQKFYEALAREDPRAFARFFRLRD